MEFIGRTVAKWYGPVTVWLACFINLPYGKTPYSKKVYVPNGNILYYLLPYGCLELSTDKEVTTW